MMLRRFCLALGLSLAPIAALAQQGGEAMPLEEPVEEGPGVEAAIEGLLGSDPSDVFTEEQAARFGEATAARLRGLDTLTNEVVDFTIRVGETLRFERLVVALDACRFPAENPEADAYAYLRIRDERDDAERFRGWMLASSPALSALDHPRYDVWVLSCTTE